MVASAILIYEVLSEFLAVYALYQQQAVNSTGQTVLIGVILLTIATAAGPARTFLRYYIRSSKRNVKRPELKDINTAGGGKMNPATPGQPDRPDQPGRETEPGKTDPA